MTAYKKWIEMFGKPPETEDEKLTVKVANLFDKRKKKQENGGNEMPEFKQYRRTQIAEMRPVTSEDIAAFGIDRFIHPIRDTELKVSISDADKANGSPKIGDMIARNPKSHADQWLVSEQYFKDNFEAIDTVVKALEKPTYTAEDMESFAEWCNDCPYALLADGKWSIIDDNVIVTTAQLREMWEQERRAK